MAKKIIITLIILILASAVTVLSFWVYDLQQQNQKLVQKDQEIKKFPEIQQEKQEQAKKEMEEKKQEETDERILVSAENLDEINKQTWCDVTFNKEPADEDIVYEGFGISFKVPYNKKWGTEKYRISAFDEDKENKSVKFGPASVFEGCGWGRSYQMHIKEQRGLAEIEKSWSEAEIVEGERMEKTTINGMQVVKFYEKGICEHPNIEVVGETFNYAFYVTCSSDMETDMKVLENYVKSMKFVTK